eukprot:TRINITY_DN10867_c0_g1_i1.p1 TRINITY_DN10867_c0_g1~~TRINITY_DN10867_c0_g1_i1.p1  ORF type:complete len:209 (+),score=47.27 TRINITY_DN10867_c0_g1_i1:171-797(+)
MTNDEVGSHMGGLIITNNDTIRSFLSSASQNPDLSYELQQIASNLSSQSSIPYKGLRNLWSASPSASRPKLLHLFSGSDFVLTSPKQREKSEELKERLRKLADLAERNAYKELVRDITPMTRTPADSFSSYKDQIGFGLHVVVTMFTGFLVGYAAFRALFNRNPVMSAAGGILGLVCCMLLETVLFIIRTSDSSTAASSSTSKLKKQQ